MRINKTVTGRKSLLIGLAGLILVIAILESTNTTHLLHKQKIPSVIPAHLNNSQSNRKQGSSSRPDSASTDSSQQSNTPPPETLNHTLITPSGNFVSNHFPGQNGSPTTEASFCNTSPGATCYIKFTNISTGVITKLPSQIVDAHGSASWYWDIDKDAHLTSGEWRVTAVATLGTQTKSANDSLNLTIQ